MPENFHTVLLFIGFLLASPIALAYTGSLSIMPPVIGGPEHTTTTLFNVDTTSGPVVIDTSSLHYVEKIEISTTEPIDSVLLVKEYPPEQGQSRFDFIVPQKFNDVLDTAIVYIWAPDVNNLTIFHDHKGKVEEVTPVLFAPRTEDGLGNVLWYFSVNSFSSFYIVEDSNPSSYVFLTGFDSEGVSRTEWLVSVSSVDSFTEFLAMTSPVLASILFFVLMSLASSIVYKRNNRKRWGQ